MKSFEIKTKIHFGDNTLERLAQFALNINHYADVALIAIPTTSGTGSEVTSFAVVNDTTAKIKHPLVSPSLTAEEAILDAELVKSVPPSITADTGMDVLTHAIEAYLSTDHNEFSTALAEISIFLMDVPMQCYYHILLNIMQISIKTAEAALADACTATNPRKPDKEAIMQIYRNLW